MKEELSRTCMLFGQAAMTALAHSRVAVFGVGGVGGHAVEVLARSGVGAIDLIDHDSVNLSNINRQLLALHSTVGRLKVEIARERINDINPGCRVTTWPMFFLPENADGIDLSVYDYVVDCIDTVSAKLELARRCHRLGVPMISSMGAGAKKDATAFRVADLQDTKNDPLARILRKKLRKEGIEHLKVVYSEEAPCLDGQPTESDGGKRPLPSNAFVPATAGMIVGGEVVKDIIGNGRLK